MSYRKKVKENSKGTATVFANWLSQLCMMLLPRFLYMIAGRASSKTTDIQVERLIEMVFDMPGAPAVWVSDTYANPWRACWHREASENIQSYNEGFVLQVNMGTL